MARKKKKKILFIFNVNQAMSSVQGYQYNTLTSGEALHALVGVKSSTN